MPKLETAHNLTSYCLFSIIKVDSYDSGIYSKDVKESSMFTIY